MYSRLKPVPQGYALHFAGLCMPAMRGTGFSREGASANTLHVCGVTPDVFPAKAGPTGGYAFTPTGDAVYPTGLCMPAICGTGFSREEASAVTLIFAV